MPDVVDKIIDTENEDDQSKIVQFRTLYHLAKEGQPLSQFNSLIDLQRMINCPDLQDKSKIYTSWSCQMEMLDAIDCVIQDSVNVDINHSDYVGIILDETTDVTIYKKLNVYFKCLSAKDKTPIIHFIDCVSILDGKADTIISAIAEMCKTFGISCSKVSSMAIDGASVMTGRLNGVGAKFRNLYNPRLLHVHCIAHRLALAAVQACSDISMFNDFQNTVKFVYRYFHNSPVRYNQLHAMEDVLEDDNMLNLALKEPASFRWLSLEAAGTAIFDVYPALVKTLESEASKGDSEAKGLYNKVRTVTFVFLCAFLKDVLNVLNKLSKIFQDNVDIDTVNVMLTSTLDRISQLKTENGRHLQGVYSELESSDGVYRDTKLQDRHTMRISFQNSSAGYLDQLSDNIRDRFDTKSMI